MIYGCEIWGTQPQDISEIFYRKFILKILYIRPFTPSCMVYGDVGKLPLHVTIDKRLMSFWLRLLNKEESSLAHIIYMSAHICLFVVYIKRLCRVKHIVDKLSMAEPIHDGY